MGNLDTWNRLKSVPDYAKKIIPKGRLTGKTDIKPQWRYMAMTELYGECGVGWWYDIVDMWTIPASDGQMMVFVKVNLFTTDSTLKEWSKPIPAIGGDFLIKKESSGLHSNDEAYKMAVTDALGKAMSMIGVAADVYMDAPTKYDRATETSSEPPKNAPQSKPEAPADKNRKVFEGLKKKLSDMDDKDPYKKTVKAWVEKYLTDRNTDIASMTDSEIGKMISLMPKKDAK